MIDEATRMVRCECVGGYPRLFPRGPAYSVQVEERLGVFPAWRLLLAPDSSSSVAQVGQDALEVGDQPEAPRPLGRDLEERDGVDSSAEGRRANREALRARIQARIAFRREFGHWP